ncbi:hypothetical protein BCR33DRAFT_737040 [Rhizoclosmatium globosum]|uniref:Uncharacterized protein n=1 Tax=Rhizoclosmatium globosum TaxID=329046 RepID=A0A1Y2CFW5_9FUNG|nr:hypothetical protein BCR33DRAFT_737040 [Rhizoclosmatium globosum]|eukprot:ORY45922.1 hypothetical protein BCR33DRAFT_737040 [Rhizoclosmatium globosum]
MKKGATASKGKKGAKEEAAVELPPPPPPQDEPPPVEVVIERKPVDRTFLTEKLNLDRINRVDKVLKKTYSVPALKKDPNVEEKKVEGDPGLSDNNGGSLLRNPQQSPYPRQKAKIDRQPQESSSGTQNYAQRNRALGVPPDPNDSDDSLLAEINEATDDKLFPGFQFGKKGSKPVLQSTHPVRLNISQIKKKLKDHIKYTESNSSITKDSDEAAFLLSHPKEVLDSFTPKTLKTFEGLVIQKYYKNGAITGFKGKDEIQTIKLKTMARNEIEDIKTNAISTENNLIDLRSFE